MSASAFLSVGDEILAGRIVDTNAVVAARLLAREGFPLAIKESVGDDILAIADAIRRLRARVPVVVVSGGIGPTADDVTREGLAATLGRPLVQHQDARTWLQAWLHAIGRELNDRNITQTYVPEGVQPVRNARGTACGLLAQEPGQGLVFVGPGVPQEFEGLLTDGLVPVLRAHPERGLGQVTAKLTVIGLPESEVGARLKDLMARGREPVVGCYPRTAGQVLVVTGAADADGSAEVQRVADEIARRLGDAVIARDEVSLGEVVVQDLRRAGKSLAIAESLTGGRTADLLVATPGASQVFKAGITAYANEAKLALLCVEPATIERFGAVSGRCAAEMAAGARWRAAADLAVSLTGVAGPSGGSPEKPVGLVHFGLDDGVSVWSWARRIPGSREEIRERAAHAALDLVRRALMGALPTDAERHEVLIPRHGARS